jgi:hypothetical protein
VWTVHDWDSLAWQPEAALAGAASAVFGRDAGPNELAPIESSVRREPNASAVLMPSTSSRSTGAVLSFKFHAS